VAGSEAADDEIAKRRKLQRVLSTHHLRKGNRSGC
jgi:hypothetical protein